jgi:pyrophosphatase PpaX
VNEQPKPSWRTVIFDLDGTLADTVDLIVQSHQHAIRTVLGKEEDPEILRSWIGRTLVVAYHDYCPDRAEDLEREYLQWNEANTERLIRSYDGIGAMLEDLSDAGLGLGVATSKRRSQAINAMEILGLAKHLPVLVAMEDTDKHKPDPEPLLLAARQLAASPSQTVYVGDAVVDTLAGKAAGMSTVAVTWGAGTRDGLAGVRPDRVATTPDELRDVLLAG